MIGHDYLVQHRTTQFGIAFQTGIQKIYKQRKIKLLNTIGTIATHVCLAAMETLQQSY